VQPFTVPGGQARIDASVGIAVAARSAHDEQALIRRADGAMYEAKKKGGGNFVVNRPGTVDGPAAVDERRRVDVLLA
jgi:predicted signal transduction protein with EAL and GGDEF domain